MSEAIAGTIQRDDNIITDKQLEEQLRNDSKNLNEHQLVVDEIKRVLKPQISNIEIPNSPGILKLKNVQHLITKIKGKLKDKKHIFELIKTLHPTPAVSGYPINKAYQLINKYEQYDRGWYSGPIGWVNAAGDGDFCVALRSALMKDNSICLFSGGGIVLNSIAENEWKETELKFQTIREIIKDN
tara:strand:- start:87 stop:641 length:555 start_codon:yes stop_codon:yes gene_type:complete